MAIKIVLLLCALACVVVADIQIDDFTVTSPKLALGNGGPQSNSVLGTSIVGGERDLRIQGTSSGCSQSFPEASVDGTQKAFLLSNPSTTVTTCFGSATAQYDGTDGSSNLQMGLNLNLATATSFDITIANDNNPGIRYTVKLYSSATNVCTNSFEFLGQGTTVPVVRSIPFSAFSTGCSLGNIGAIEVTLEGGTDNDQNVRFIKITQPVAGSITVNVFDDCDCNGSQGTGESSRSGISVAITGAGACSSITQTQTTSSAGVASFGGLQAGCTFAVTLAGQTLCAGASNSRSVTIVASQTQAVTFGIFCPPKLGAITVNVYDDCDCNGSQGTGESSRSGISVAIAGAGACSGTTQTLQTNSAGTLTFGNLNAGCTFAVAIQGQSLCGSASSTQTVTVSAGLTSVVSYGIFCPPKTGDITGIVYTDCGCDGVQGTGDNGVNGVTVSITSTGATQAVTTTSANGGTFAFGGLLAGSYTVSVNSAACNTQGTSKTVAVAAGATARVEFSTLAPSCGIVAPPSAAVKCGDSTSESATGSPTVTGGCVATAVDGPASQACDPSVCGFSQSFTRTWTVTSQCGGTQSASQTITVSACQPGACPPCNNNPASPVAPVSPIVPFSPVEVSSVAPASPRNPAPNSPNSPNAPNNCRQVCDDDSSSSAASTGVSFLLAFVALIAALLF